MQNVRKTIILFLNCPEVSANGLDRHAEWQLGVEQEEDHAAEAEAGT